MVRVFLLIFMLYINLLGFGQIDCDTLKLNIVIGRHIMSYPIYGGYALYSELGSNAFYSFLQTNLVYPQAAREEKIEGIVVVTFWIDSTAATSNFKISEGVREDIDNEALRVAKLIKFDKPAIDYYGNPTCMYYTLYITFRLDDPEFLLYKQSDKDKPVRKKKSKSGGSSEVIDNKKRNNGL
ncbi:MAG: energy transducer TonB [Bacteroidales bacterium]|jgi:TonB family protein|nr:energy transducer TonB [Bacteroidales bacterium]